MPFTVDTDRFGPTGKMRRQEAVRLSWRPMRSVRKWRYPAFWWRRLPRDEVVWYRRVLRRDVKPR